jgi:hypothetical protein
MVRRCLAYAAVAIWSSSIASVLPARGDPRAVVELFTSQGCSSCPAADQLLGELAGDSSLVPISLPIDYWDYLGWKDTLADPRNTARQKGYSKVRGDREVYTPQVVVNGTLHVLGSDRAAIEHAIAESRQNAAALSVPVTLSIADGDLIVTAPDADNHAAGDVWLCGLAKAITVAVARGENRGKTITYHNVARRWLKLGMWSGKAEVWRVPLRDLDGDSIDEAAVLLQAGTVEKPSTILGSALAAIH